jgi:hypothetical protein
MSEVNSPPPPAPPSWDAAVFKWVCLLVAVAALSAYGWMLNDIRRDVKGLTEKADRQLPVILEQAERVSGQLDRHLPRILSQTEQATTTINTQLPALLTRSEEAVDNLADLSDRFKQYQGLMGAVHGARQDKGLFAYGTSILSLLGKQDATIGVKKPGPDKALKKAVPAREWAKASQKDAHSLSLVATSKEEVLHGLARTRSAAPLYIQFASEAPRLLADWLREAHPESKDVP